MALELIRCGRFEDVKDHSDKERIARKDQILELSFKHEMIVRIVEAVDLIKDIQKSSGILKELRDKINNEAVFEKDIADVCSGCSWIVERCLVADPCTVTQDGVVERHVGADGVPTCCSTISSREITLTRCRRQYRCFALLS